MTEPNGLLAAGGDLSTERLLAAYARGIFPWYDEGQPILWWSPAPRCVLRPDSLHVSRRLRQYAKRAAATVTFNRAFEATIDACAEERPSQLGTWITPDMRAAYMRLHDVGWAHSIEAWVGDQHIGGLYGVAIGKVFFGESMFSAADNGSKFAMMALCQTLVDKGFSLLDCQVVSQHLLSLGAEHLPRGEFVDILERDCFPHAPFKDWPSDPISLASLC